MAHESVLHVQLQHFLAGIHAFRKKAAHVVLGMTENCLGCPFPGKVQVVEERCIGQPMHPDVGFRQSEYWLAPEPAVCLNKKLTVPPEWIPSEGDKRDSKHVLTQDHDFAPEPASRTRPRGIMDGS